jgi:zinc D-Ala-D-Ala carboxypeptidase
MRSDQLSSTSRHAIRAAVLACWVVISLSALLGCRSAPDASAHSPDSAAPSNVARSTETPRGAPDDPPGALGVADGRLPDAATVFDDAYPGVARLDPDLHAALRRAATDAARAGVTVHLTSGWRSPAYQERLLEDAVSSYGSRAEAARWVASPATSPHVKGAAVDIRNTDATTWLGEHGARYGLCRVFRNEPWHFELRPAAEHGGCPRQYPDPSHDPRMTR